MKPNGEMDLQLRESLTAELAQDIKFECESFQVWQSGAGLSFATPEQLGAASGKVVSEVIRADAVANSIFVVDSINTTRWAPAIGGLILNLNALRHFCDHWLSCLIDENEEARANTLSAKVDQIISVIENERVPEKLRERCKTAWQSVLEYEQLQELLSRAVASPDGLVLVELTRDGRAPLVAQLDKISTVIHACVKLARELEHLLNELQAAGFVKVSAL